MEASYKPFNGTESGPRACVNFEKSVLIEGLTTDQRQIYESGEAGPDIAKLRLQLAISQTKVG
jgi:hypothetical protein